MCDSGNQKLKLCGNLEEWKVEGRFKREGIYVYLWLIHVAMWQKPSQYCKVIILQLNKMKFLKNILKNHFIELKIRVLAGLCSLLAASGENPFPCPFQLLEAIHIPWLMAAFLHLQCQQ